MVITKKKDAPTVQLMVDGEAIEQVKSFVYLGNQIEENGYCDNEIKRRIEIARNVFNRMNKVLTTSYLKLTTRFRILKCYVWSALLYGAETFTLNSITERKIEAFEMWTLRRMLKISWKDMISNEKVLEKAKVKRELLEIIKYRKLSYFGHVIRHDTLQRNILEGKINGSKAIGRPRITWFNNIKEWLKMSYVEAKYAANNRRSWRQTVANVSRNSPTIK